MSYTKCVYHNCDNTSQDISMFRFPVKCQDRLLRWKKNSGNILLDSLTNEELRCRYICAAHFPPSNIHKGLRSRLIGPAVPVHFQCFEVGLEGSKNQSHVDAENDPHVYPGGKKEDAVTTQQNVSSQVEQNVASQVEQDIAPLVELDSSSVDFGDHGELEQYDKTSFLFKELPSELTNNNGCDLDVEQTVDLTSEQTEEASEVCVGALSAKDPVDTEVIWLPGSPKKPMQKFGMDKNVASIHDEKRVITAREKEKSKGIIMKQYLAPSLNRKLKMSTTPSASNAAYLKEGKCFTLSRMQFSKQWLKYCKLSGLERDRKLMEYLSCKIDLNAIKESREQVKNIISEMSGYLSKVYAKNKWNINVLINNKVIRRQWSMGWLNGPPIRFTPAVPQKKGVTVVSLKQPGKPLIEKHQPNTKQEVICMSLITNADVFKFLRISRPPFKADSLYILLKALSKDLIKANEQKAEEFCNRYVADIKFKWMTADNKENVFESKFAFWLGLTVKWPAFLKSILGSKYPNAAISMNIKDLEHAIAKKCCEYGQEDVSDIIHRMFHHPEDAVRIRSFVESSACSCNAKPVEKIENDKSTEVDPLMPESEIYRTTDASEGLRLTDNNTLERVYKAPSGPRLNALKQALNILKDKKNNKNNMADQINKESERINTVSHVLCNLKSGNNKMENTPVLRKEINKTVNASVLMKESNQKETGENPLRSALVLTNESNKTVNTPVLTKESNQKETGENLVFGPVLDKLIYLNSVLSVKNGTKVSLPTGKIATVAKVSNIQGGTILLPTSSIQRGAKVQPKKPLKSGAISLQKPNTLNNQSSPGPLSNKPANTPVASFSAKRRIGILRNPPKNPVYVTSRLIKGGPLPLIPFNQQGIVVRPNAANLMLVKTVAPNNIKKTSPGLSSSMNNVINSVYRKAPSHINSSVEALMADINTGNMQKDNVQSSLSRLISHSKLLESSKTKTETREKDTRVQSPLSQLISHYKIQTEHSVIPNAESDIARKLKTEMLFTPNIMPLSDWKTSEPPAKKNKLNPIKRESSWDLEESKTDMTTLEN